MTTDPAGSSEVLEVERKFDLGTAQTLPTFATIPGVASVDDPLEYQLDAEYFDTPDLALATRHLALRRRTGGSDAGWHLKAAVDEQTRQEFHEPLGDDPRAVPEAIMRRLRVHLRDRPLHPVVRLQTHRVVTTLRDGAGAALAEVSDDRVHADRLIPGRPGVSDWRECEVELVEGGMAVLDAAESALAAAGVRRSKSVSKLARALGDSYPQPQAPALHANADDSSGQVLLAYLDKQVRMLWQQDPMVREDAPDALHQMRVATRRLRSALNSYRPLLDPTTGRWLLDELGWLAGILGSARDLQVLRERLQERAADEPVSGHIDGGLESEYSVARLAVLHTLDDERYFRLLDALDRLLAAPPLTDLGARPAAEVLPELLAREWKRLRAAVRAAEKASKGKKRDLALHETRKAAKRVRYAAEAASALQPERANRLAKAAEELQSILGDHQDGVMARRLLHRSRATARSNGEDGSGYGRLEELERTAAVTSEAEFFRAWEHFPGPSLQL